MKMRIAAITLGFMQFTLQASAQDAFAFFRGEQFPPARTSPAAWLHELHKADGLLNANIAVAEFLPNTKLAWHNHPGGQILLITDGVGYYQERGKQRQVVRVGDVIKCLPGVEHWHGAAVESGVTYVATSPAQKGGTVWGAVVTDEEYASPATDRRSTPAARKMGAAMMAELLKADDIFPFAMSIATFAPGKKVEWRKDAGGQVLIVTHGVGYYEERGQPKRVVRKGDVIKTAAGVDYLNGAASEIGVTYLAIKPAVSRLTREGFK
jgi:quercetin dioxygenase-like cupin family protein